MKGWSKEHIDALSRKASKTPTIHAPAKTATTARAGRNTIHKSGEMNKLESAYADHLRGLKALGEVADFSFEQIKFRLADKTFYTPDFFVLCADGRVEFHEVKGFWEDDARVKIKVAAEQFPFRFVGVQRKNGAWIKEEF